LFKPIGYHGKSRFNHVSSLIDSNGAWEEGLARKTSPLLEIKTSPRRDADFLAWQPENSGIFMVCGAYKLGLSLVHQEMDVKR
jgi:hypothetical protein